MKNIESRPSIGADAPGRIEWIDTAKTIGIGLMIVDHTLLYFGQEHHWSRFTITRLAEPLLVLSLFHVLAVRSRGITLKRWLQICGAALVETGLHSYREGHLYFGILSSLALTLPLVVPIAQARQWFLQCLMIVSIPVSLLGAESDRFTIDYGSALLIGQVCIASRLSDLHSSIRFCLLSLGVALGGGIMVVEMGFHVHSNFWTIVIGQPIAVVVMLSIQRSEWPQSVNRKTRIFVRRPLSVYLVHLTALQFADSVACPAQDIDPRPISQMLSSCSEDERPCFCKNSIQLKARSTSVTLPL